MFVFRKIWRPLFSQDTRFEIRPFACLITDDLLFRFVASTSTTEFHLKGVLMLPVYSNLRIIPVYISGNRLQPSVQFYTPRKHQKTFGFLTFSGGAEMYHLTKLCFKYCTYPTGIYLLKVNNKTLEQGVEYVQK